MCRSRTSLSTPCNGRLPFVFRVTRRVALRNVELFIGQLIPFTPLIQLFFFNDQDSTLNHTILAISLFAFTYIGKLIYNKIEHNRNKNNNGNAVYHVTLTQQ